MNAYTVSPRGADHKRTTRHRPLGTQRRRTGLPIHQEAQITNKQLAIDHWEHSDDEQDSNRDGPVEGDAAPQASPHPTHILGQIPRAGITK